MAKKDESSYESLAFPLNILPNELQKRILFHVPTHDAVRYKTVCKEWQLAVEAWASGTPIGFTPQPQKPFYFMFNTSVVAPNLGTYAYNSDKQRWVSLKIPNSNQDRLMDALDLSRLRLTRFDISSSGGLVCTMDAGKPDTVFVCNPILRNRIKLLPKPPGTFYLNRQGPTRHADYWSITLSTDNRKRTYDIALIRSTRMHIIECTHNTTIHFYKSDAHSWANLHSEKLGNWHVGDSCVICKDVLYGLVRLHRSVEDQTQPCYAIVAYNLSSQVKQEQCLAKTMVHVPCLLANARLLNLNDKLIIVGGVKNPKNRKIEGIIIWEMCAGNGWREITHAPDDLIRHFFERNYDCSIMCSGYGELIFIQDCTSTAVLTYELGNNVWAFLTDQAPPFPVLPHDYMTFKGFCFEPRLDIVP